MESSPQSTLVPRTEAPATPITRLIPHRDTMLRVDQLEYIDEHCAKSSFLVREDDPFLRGKALREEALIETAAQTVAAAQGWLAYELGKPLPKGLLIGMEAFHFFQPVIPGDLIQTEVSKKLEKAQLVIVNCWLSVREERVAEGLLKFALFASS